MIGQVPLHAKFWADSQNLRKRKDLKKGKEIQTDRLWKHLGGDLSMMWIVPEDRLAEDKI